MEPIQEQVCAVEKSIEEEVENLPIEEEIAQAEETSATTGIFRMVACFISLTNKAC